MLLISANLGNNFFMCLVLVNNYFLGLQKIDFLGDIESNLTNYNLML